MGSAAHARPPHAGIGVFLRCYTAPQFGHRIRNLVSTGLPTMRSTGAASILVAVLAFTATLIPRSAQADLLVFQDRVVFAQALDSDPSLVRTVEG